MPQKIENRPDLEPLLDERLLRLGRAWFAEVRRQHPEETPRRRWRDSSGDGGGSDGTDLLFDGDGGDAGD